MVMTTSPMPLLNLDFYLSKCAIIWKMLDGIERTISTVAPQIELSVSVNRFWLSFPRFL